jgi:hypothetical protein
MKVRSYVKIAEQTDQLEPRTPSHPNYKIMPILGLAGEIGSLLTELKKRVREPNRAADVGNDLIAEELGDIMWYSATIARRAKLDFVRHVLFANLIRTQSTPGLYVPNLGPSHQRNRQSDKRLIAAAVTFGSYQRRSANPQGWVMTRHHSSHTSRAYGKTLAKYWTSSIRRRLHSANLRGRTLLKRLAM